MLEVRPIVSQPQRGRHCSSAFFPLLRAGASADTRRNRFFNSLLAAQTAFAPQLLPGAGVTVKSLGHWFSNDPARQSGRGRVAAVLRTIPVPESSGCPA
jgi:hypothetical protein